MKQDAQLKRLEHIESHLRIGEDLQRLIFNIENDLGDPIACMLGLSSQALATAILAWFKERDLSLTKKYLSIAAEIDKKRYSREVNKLGAGGKVLALLKPLISDNKLLIDWFAGFDEAYDLKRIENTKTRDFWAYQSIVALRGDWARLKGRSERVLENPPASSEKKYLVDHHFHLALSKGDKRGMEEALKVILSPKVVNGRTIDESGFTEDLIFTPAVIYAKIAWMHGYEISVDSHLVPREWLSIAPLDTYEKGYDFLSKD